jgi:anti-anti-sigma factor
MKITKQKGSNKTTGLCRLQIEGDMTIYQAAEMMEKFLPCWRDYREFELNLSGVGEMDSAGIQLLLVFDRKSEGSGRKACLLDPPEAVSEVLNIYRLDHRFDIQISPRQ